MEYMLALDNANEPIRTYGVAIPFLGVTTGLTSELSTPKGAMAFLTRGDTRGLRKPPLRAELPGVDLLGTELVVARDGGCWLGGALLLLIL